MNNKQSIKKIFIWMLKFLVAGIAAFIFVNIFALFFYNYGMRTESKTGVTDYTWKSGFYCQGYEGYGFGVRNDTGFNNLDITSEDNVDILVMGSSQMEANNVPQNKNTVYLLNRMFKDNNYDIHAYNMAMEGHRIERQVNHLKGAVEYYKPQKYVVLETMDSQFSADAMEQVLNGSYGELSYKDSSIVTHYAKYSPYIRLMYAQYQAVKGNRTEKEASKIIVFEDKNDTDTEADINEDGYSDDEMEILEDFLSYVDCICSEAGAKAVILYIPTAYVKNGQYTFEHSAMGLVQLKEEAERNNIIVLDMTDAFKNYYDKTGILPYGFTNTAYGEGHLNIYGHNIIADRMYELLITDMEDENNAVQ